MFHNMISVCQLFDFYYCLYDRDGVKTYNNTGDMCTCFQALILALAIKLVSASFGIRETSYQTFRNFNSIRWLYVARCHRSELQLHAVDREAHVLKPSHLCRGCTHICLCAKLHLGGNDRLSGRAASLAWGKLCSGSRPWALPRLRVRVFSWSDFTDKHSSLHGSEFIPGRRSCFGRSEFASQFLFLKFHQALGANCTH